MNYRFEFERSLGGTYRLEAEHEEKSVPLGIFSWNSAVYRHLWRIQDNVDHPDAMVTWLPTRIVIDDERV